ncbi:uncharacterized protein LOC117336635 [Pecten maximus]|uniref:uncharacterized protein LOC117336635 n=1 Tax=Pecten maximus TaxID=6579 RepID=UPI001458C71A|nr:uncharacterized protein LOC117336635 [Pecten maximus]
MSQSFELASRKARDAQQRQKATYDLKARHAVLDIDDRVLVKILAFEGRHQLCNRWESDVYVVVGQDNPDIPVYRVRKEDGHGKDRVLHRNHLLPIGSLPMGNKVDMARPCPAPRTGITRSRRLEPAVESVSDHQSTIDSDDDFDDMGEEVATYISRPPIPEGSSSSADDSSSDDDNDDDDDELGEEEPEAGVQPEHLATPPADPINAPPTQDVPPAVPIPTPVPRRSTRERKPPSWMQSGDFVCKQACFQSEIAEWEKKAMFLINITAGDMFNRMSDVARDTLLHILKS